MSKKIGIITLGCKVNQYESEAFAEALKERGFLVCDAGEVCDAYIVNTCTVTAEADRKSRQMIRRAARLNPQAAIVVTGCTAEYSAEELASIEGVIAVCGNAKKLECVDIIAKYFERPEEKYPIINIPTVSEAPFEDMRLNAFSRTRVYIKIEDGCENKCAYCAIPRARGNVRSKKPEDVMREVSGFVDAGCKEIVLTGIETASYGKDIGMNLGALLKYIDAFVANKCMVRLGSLDPSLFKEKFVNDIKGLTSLAPHFHISLQSGSSDVLALMRRKYNADGARAALSRIREAIPNVQFTTDIIVGFPGETEENFEETVKFVKEARFLMAHIFPYSEREGTPAAKMPNSVPVEIRRERAARLTEVQNAVRDSLLDELIASAPEVEVLFETFTNGAAHGHTYNFLEVSVEAKSDLHGQAHAVRLTHHKDGICYGSFVKEPISDIKTQRKSGVVSGFRKCDDNYLALINQDLALEAEMPELHAIQNLFESVGRDPSVAELYFTLACLRNERKNAERNIFAESIEGLSSETNELWSNLMRRYLPQSENAEIPPSLTALAEFAASGKASFEKCGIEICMADRRLSPTVYSGKQETILTDKYAVSIACGRPISGSKIGDTCILLSPKAGEEPDAFISKANEVCKRIRKEFPDIKIIPASERGLIRDVAESYSGVLFDTFLLPEPLKVAEAVYRPQYPSMILFPNRKDLTRIWQIAGEYSIVPCAPAASRSKNIAVHAAEGNIELDSKVLNKLEFALPAKLISDDSAVLTRGESLSRELSASDSILTLRDVGGQALYEDIADAMSDKNAVYAIAGIIDPRDPATIPALLTLDSFRRNESPTVIYSKFFIGEKSSLTVIKLEDKK